MGREVGGAYVYLWLIHIDVWQKPTQLCKAIILHLKKKGINLQSRRCRQMWVRFLGWEDLLDKGKATHYSILAWRIPWTV